MGITDMIDPLAALVQFLLSSTATADEVGTAVYGAQLPRGETQPGQAVLVIQMGGGDVPSRLCTIDVDFQIRCYGATSVEAQAVYAAVRKDLHFARRQKITPGTGIGSGTHWMVTARETSSPQHVREFVTDWKYVAALFSCKFISFPMT